LFLIRGDLGSALNWSIFRDPGVRSVLVMTHRPLAGWAIALLLLAAAARADEPPNGKEAPKETLVVGKVVLLFDVSPSMRAVRDDLPVEGKASEKSPSRQDKVIGYLTEEKSTFLKRLQEKGPLFLYRCGGRLDPDFVVFAHGRAWSRAEWEKYQASPEPRKVPDGRPWARADWEPWLKPEPNTPDQRRLFGTANLGGSLVELLQKEAGGVVAGVIVVSDGRSTEGEEAAFREVAERVRRAEIPLFTVAAGEKPDLERLYSLASPAGRFTKHIDDRIALSLKRALREAAKPVLGEKEEDRLFFDLEGAHLIPDCVLRVERRVVPVKER
jgi:hypothetical protein